MEHHRGTKKSYLSRPSGHSKLTRVFCALFYYFGGNKEVIIVKKVGIIMGSDSDLPIIKKATDTLKSLDIPYEVHI